MQNAAKPDYNNDFVNQVLFHAVRSYKPGGFSGTMAIFQCVDRPAGRAWNRGNSWKGAANGDLMVFDIPGDHRSMFEEPNRYMNKFTSEG